MAASYLNHTLDYPPWALEFDPYNRGYLIVGGGGGAGQKEIPNKLTLLDVSNRSKVGNAADVIVEDDSPSCLGLLASKNGVFALTGVNSSADDRKAGQNEHFRSYSARYPSKSKDDEKTASISLLSKSSIFSSSFAKSKDAYQRLLRLSPARYTSTGSKRIGAIASSLATKSEIVIFDATVASPTSKEVIHIIEPANNAEVNDLDIFEVSEGEFEIVFCTRTAIYKSKISYDFTKKKLSTKVAEAELQHEILSKPAKLVSSRHLPRDHILILLARGSESELLLLKVYSKGGPGDVVLRFKLPASFGSAVSMDVASLNADPKTGEQQIAVAVAAQAKDIGLYTIDIPAKGSPRSIKKFRTHSNVHDAPMKKVVFSPFFSPYDDPSKPQNPKKSHPEQYLRLASISLSNNLVIDTFTLVERTASDGKPRYLLDSAGPVAKALRKGTNIFVTAFVLLVSTIILQSYLDSQAPAGQVSQYQILPAPITQFINRARQDNDPLKHVIHEVVDTPTNRLRDLLHGHKETKETIVIRPAEEDGHELTADVHKDGKAVEDPHAKRWDELSTKQQENWKRRLTKAGKWSVDEGETILKSIFFSEVAGAIGRAALGAME